MRKRIPYQTKVREVWTDVHDQLNNVKFSSLETEYKRLPSWNSEQCSFALTCNCKFQQRRESSAVNLTDAFKVFTATKIKETKYESHSSFFCLSGCAWKHGCFKQISTGTHTLRGEPLKVFYSIQGEGFKRAFPKSDLRLLWKQREGMSAQTLPIDVPVVFILSVFVSSPLTISHRFLCCLSPCYINNTLSDKVCGHLLIFAYPASPPSGDSMPVFLWRTICVHTQSM